MTTSIYYLPPPDHREALLAEGPAGERVAIVKALADQHGKALSPFTGDAADLNKDEIAVRYLGGAPIEVRRAYNEGRVLLVEALALLVDNRPCPGAINRLREAVARYLMQSLYWAGIEELIAGGVIFIEDPSGIWTISAGGNDISVFTADGARCYMFDTEAVPALASLPSEHRTLYALARVVAHVLGGEVAS